MPKLYWVHAWMVCLFLLIKISHFLCTLPHTYKNTPWYGTQSVIRCAPALISPTCALKHVDILLNMFQKRSTLTKYFIATVFGATLFCEWFVYILGPYFWPDLRCHTHDPSCTKVLFIADPQIQGDYEFPVPLSYLTEWDSDRYLRSTFSVVIRHFKPDVLVYLGDLMDEGSISTLPQYHQYVKRLFYIFDVDYPVVQVWVPGDNDIGGEDEPIRKDKILEFAKVYQQPEIISFANISFYKVNGITHSYPKLQEDDDRNDKLRIVVSHYPITSSIGFGKRVNKEIRPHIYFSAHDHNSKFVKQDRNLDHRTTSPLLFGKEPLEINLSNGDELYEISVPTCSYRMGVNQMGFGAAVIGNGNKHIRYTVFESPVRFPYLFVYLCLLAIALLYFCTFGMVRAYLACTKRLWHTNHSYRSLGHDKA